MGYPRMRALRHLLHKLTSRATRAGKLRAVLRSYELADREGDAL